MEADVEGGREGRKRRRGRREAASGVAGRGAATVFWEGESEFVSIWGLNLGCFHGLDARGISLRSCGCGEWGNTLVAIVFDEFVLGSAIVLLVVFRSSCWCFGVLVVRGCFSWSVMRLSSLRVLRVHLQENSRRLWGTYWRGRNKVNTGELRRGFVVTDQTPWLGELSII
ncbi:hypothetical protein Droror1_Dr00024708 [Drosera rotundifolia]